MVCEKSILSYEKNKDKCKFVNLHSHSESSKLDCLIRVEELVDKAVSLGMKGVAISDHGNMGSLYKLHQATTAYQQRGIPIKPLYGCEYYFVDEIDNRDSRTYHHLTLYAMNNIGLMNLMYLTSASYIQGMYGKPRIDWELLASHAEGVVGLSGCVIGKVSDLLLKDEYMKAVEALDKFKTIFQGNFFLEIQPAPLDFQIKLNDLIVDLGEKTDTPVIVTTDSHYLEPDDFDFHEAMLCIQTQNVLSNPDRFSFDCPEFYYADQDDIEQRVMEIHKESVKEGCQEFIENSLKVVDMCDVKIDTSEIYFPDFPVPECEEGFIDYWTRAKKESFI